MARYISKIPKPTSSKQELEKALQLHDAMSLARDAGESLVTILEILRDELVPWPSIHDLGFEAGAFERAQESLSHANLGNLTRDLSIWIVEHYYQPGRGSTSQVRAASRRTRMPAAVPPEAGRRPATRPRVQALGLDN